MLLPTKLTATRSQHLLSVLFVEATLPLDSLPWRGEHFSISFDDPSSRRANNNNIIIHHLRLRPSPVTFTPLWAHSRASAALKPRTSRGSLFTKKIMKVDRCLRRVNIRKCESIDSSIPMQPSLSCHSSRSMHCMEMMLEYSHLSQAQMVHSLRCQQLHSCRFYSRYRCCVGAETSTYKSQTWRF